MGASPSAMRPTMGDLGAAAGPEQRGKARIVQDGEDLHADLIQLIGAKSARVAGRGNPAPRRRDLPAERPAAIASADAPAAVRQRLAAIGCGNGWLGPRCNRLVIGGRRRQRHRMRDFGGRILAQPWRNLPRTAAGATIAGGAPSLLDVVGGLAIAPDFLVVVLSFDQKPISGRPK